MLRIPLPEDDGFALALSENGTKHQKRGQASSGPKAIAPRCGRVPSVLALKSPWQCKKRGKSGSAGFCRASFCVFAVKPPWQSYGALPIMIYE